jgi:hypothetical protein
MGTKSEELAKATPYETYNVPHPYSFELNMDMLGLIRKEFDPPLVVSEFARALGEKGKGQTEAVAEKIFGKYGAEWMKKSIQLGEEYPDRTYEVLRIAADKTGELGFPLVLQRFVEIAYLSTQQFRLLKIVENWSKRLVYALKDCYMFKTLQAQCGGGVANALPCRHACLTAIQTAAQSLQMDVSAEMEAMMGKDGYCQFAINRR